MTTKGRQLHDGTKEKGQEQKVMAPDLISGLPDYVIHHILSFLPTIDVVRMSLLSRRWRRIWYSVPALEFCCYDIEEEFFSNFVEQCLEQRKICMQHDTNSVIARFKLKMNYDGDSSQVDRWLSFAAQPHLQELYINLSSEWFIGQYYCLPRVALNLTSLTILYLEFMELEYCSPINLPSLKSLSLKNVDVKDEVLHNLVLGCPSLQKLFIKEGYMNGLRISSSSLEFLDIDGEWDDIQVDAINLESFVYFGNRSCTFDLTSCKELAHLSLTNAYFDSDEDFKSLISGFPLLEDLILKGCDPFEIHHQFLKVLVLEKCEAWEKPYEISIDAPNLVSFTYSGVVALVKVFINMPNLLETNIALDSYCSTSLEWSGTSSLEWYVDILDFLTYLNCAKSMSVDLYSEEDLIIPEKLRKLCHAPLHKLKHLKVKTRCKLRRGSDLKKALRWLAPSLETLSIEQGLIHDSLLL